MTNRLQTKKTVGSDHVCKPLDFWKLETDGPGLQLSLVKTSFLRVLGPAAWTSTAPRQPLAEAVWQIASG